jgi:outer membrane protein OmpA-like peptidoglycan-associated protein
MPAKPMLDDLELQQVQKLSSEEEQVVEQHGVPALEGDFLQGLGRRATAVTLTGVLTGPEAADGLKKLREKFRAAAAVPFVDDIATATKIDKVLIEEMQVRELAGKPERFEYAIALREFIVPPKSKEEPAPNPPEPKPTPKTSTGTLVVEVTVEGQPGFDFSTVTVSVDGTKDEDNSALSRTLTNRSNNVWTEEDMPAGKYTAKAVVTDPQPMSGTVDAAIKAGETTRVSITLTPGNVIAKRFIVTFRFDKAFLEPCMRGVLQQVQDYANGHKDEKLVIVGHTDLTGSDEYNQSLSERRARSVFAFLTFGRAPDASVSEWNSIRQKQKGVTTLGDNWGTRQYQHMLQDLGFYPGNVNGVENKATQDAVRAFRRKKGLPGGTTVDDSVWNALIRDYMAQDKFDIPTSQFLPNCPTDTLQWLGCGEKDPVKNTRAAWRPNRRVELLFVTAKKLPCEVPPPDTFDLPIPGAVAPKWCLGSVDKQERCCFVTPATPPGVKPQGDQWTREPAEPGTITVEVSIKKQVRKDDGTFELKPAAGQKFVVIAADGEFLAAELSSGEPQPAVTKTDGTKSFPDKPVGIYTLEVIGDVLVRLEEDSADQAKGNAVCKHLTVDDNHLDVIILPEPPLREIRLNAVAHLMTALHPATRSFRRCPAPLDPSGFALQMTVHTKENVTNFIAGANEIWRQARVHLELVDLVEEVYAFRTDCEVDDNEFGTLLERCAYPNVVNFFFVGDLSGNSEAGLYLQVPVTDPRGTVDGCAISDRFQSTIFQGTTLDIQLDAKQTMQVAAHEFGHFLSLGIPDHVPDTSANSKRLMLAGTSDGSNRTIAPDEVKKARASDNSGLEFVPITLKVTGATQVGGTLSHEFIVIQKAGGVVRVDAQVEDTLGTVVMAGGNPGANDKQKTVATDKAGNSEVRATFTPDGGGKPVQTQAVISVVTFRLRVDGATATDATQTKFVARPDPNNVVTIIAEIAAGSDPPPFCMPTDIITWDKGDEGPDPLRRTVSRKTPKTVTVTANLADATASVTITILEVAITDSNAPFDKALTKVQIEGILNTDRKSFSAAALFDQQPDSLFRARVDLAGVTGNTLAAKLTSKPPGAVAPESMDITLTRTTGDRFVSLPILAIPAAIPRNEITMKNAASPDLLVIRAVAQGTMRLEIAGQFADLGAVEIKVRGRVVELCNVTITGANSQPARDLSTANRVWAQLGIEMRVLNNIPINRPDLLDIDDAVAAHPGSPEAPASPEETALLKLGRDTCTSDLIGYHVRTSSRQILGVTLHVPFNAGFYQVDAASQYTWGHELGHELELKHEIGSAKNLMTDQSTANLPDQPNVVELTKKQANDIKSSSFILFKE